MKKNRHNLEKKGLLVVTHLPKEGNLIEVFHPFADMVNKKLETCPGCSKTHQTLHRFWNQGSEQGGR